MARTRQRSIELSIPASDIDREVHEGLLAALGDPACRSILHATTERALTAAELGDELDLPLSTVYRKLEQLTATPLIEETYRLPTDGKNSRQYRCVVNHVRVTVAEADDRTADAGPRPVGQTVGADGD